MPDPEKQYYRAVAKQGNGSSIRPPFLPSKIEVNRTVTSDIANDWDTRVMPGVYECECNEYGAVSVKAKNGRKLGLKPNEFEVVEWKENPDHSKTAT